MFLKLATVFAILGVLVSLLLSFIQQGLIMGRIYSPGIQLIFRFLTIGEKVSLGIPLIIFLVAFLLSLNAKKS